MAAFAFVVQPLMLHSASEAFAAEGDEPPPTGRGLVISGSVVGGIGLALMIPGTIMAIAGRNSREGMASAIGGILLGFGGVFVATGTGLLVPGLVRRRRYRDYEAAQMEAAAHLRPNLRAGLSPGGFVLRF